VPAGIGRIERDFVLSRRPWVLRKPFALLKLDALSTLDFSSFPGE